MKKLLLYSFIAFTTVFFTGCSEELEMLDSPSTKPLTGDTRKSWRFENFEFIYDDEQLGTTRITNPPCVFSGVLVFHREGRVLDVNTSCDPLAGGESIPTFWGINFANTTLQIGGLDPFELVELTQTTLKFGFRTAIQINNVNFQTGFAQYTYRVQSQ